MGPACRSTCRAGRLMPNAVLVAADTGCHWQAHEQYRDEHEEDDGPPRFARPQRPSLFEPRTLGLQHRETSLRGGDLLDTVLAIRGLHDGRLRYRDRGGI